MKPWHQVDDARSASYERDVEVSRAHLDATAFGSGWPDGRWCQCVVPYCSFTALELGDVVEVVQLVDLRALGRRHKPILRVDPVRSVWVGAECRLDEHRRRVPDA
jgi:hypothetical protein